MYNPESSGLCMQLFSITGNCKSIRFTCVKGNIFNILEIKE